MGFAEYSNFDGLGLAALVREKKISTRELVDEAILVIRASPSDPANVLTIKLGLIQALLAAEATNRQVSCYYSDTDAEILHVGF